MSAVRIIKLLVLILGCAFFKVENVAAQDEQSGIQVSKTKGKNLDDKTQFIKQFTRIKVKKKTGEIYKGKYELVGGQYIRVANFELHLSEVEWIQIKDFSSIWMVNSSVLLTTGMAAIGGLYYLGNPLAMRIAVAEYHFFLAGVGALLTTGFIVKYNKKKVKNHWRFDAVVISG